MTENSGTLSLIAWSEQLAARLWRAVGGVPLALKLIGLAVLPLVLAGGADLLFMRESIRVFIAASGDHPQESDLLFALTREGLRVLLVGGLVGLGLATFLTWALVHPLHELIHVMRQVQTGDLTARTGVWAPDEIGQLQAAFNKMVTSLRESRNALLRQQHELEELNAENSRLVSELRANGERLQQLFRDAISAQEAERKRLARELHDETGQSLTSILLQLKALQGESDPDVIYDRLNGLRYLTGRTIEEVRRLAADLRPTVLDDLGLVPAIRWCTQECATRSGIRIMFDGDDSIGRLPAEVEIVLYRAAQESLTNIMRHSQANCAEVVLKRAPRSVSLIIADNGIGFEPEQNQWSSIGLSGMRERVALAGGELRVDTQPGAGTGIFIRIPLEQSDE